MMAEERARLKETLESIIVDCIATSDGIGERTLYPTDGAEEIIKLFESEIGL